MDRNRRILTLCEPFYLLLKLAVFIRVLILAFRQPDSPLGELLKNLKLPLHIDDTWVPFFSKGGRAQGGV